MKPIGSILIIVSIFTEFIGSMFKTIFKGNFGAVAQNTALAIAILLGLSQGAKAEDIKPKETIEVSCNPFAIDVSDSQCDSNSSIEPEPEQIAQRRGRRRKSRVEGYYAGGSLGVFFPNDIEDEETNNAFGGSIFGGIRFSRYFSADIEAFGAFGDFEDATDDDPNTEDVELDYSAIGFYINPRAELPLFQIAGSFASIYISPGIGISQSNISVDFNTPLNQGATFEISEIDATQLGFSFQIKGGVKVPISRTINVFGQVRYATLPTDDFLLDDSLNLFSTEAGVSFNF